MILRIRPPINCRKHIYFITKRKFNSITFMFCSKKLMGYLLYLSLRFPNEGTGYYLFYIKSRKI